MTPPTPAAVRYALRTNYDDTTLLERGAYLADERDEMDLLSDHIRAVCAEMRDEATDCVGSDWEPVAVMDMLRSFADRLEGREP